MNAKKEFFITIVAVLFVIIFALIFGTVASTSHTHQRDSIVIRKERLSIVAPDTDYYIEEIEGQYRYRIFEEGEVNLVPKESVTIKTTSGSFIYVDIYKYQCSGNYETFILIDGFPYFIYDTCSPEYKYIFYVPEGGIHYLGD